MEQLLTRLVDKFGYDKPIATDEILTAWGDYSRPWVFRLLKRFNEEQKIIKYESGIYYLPTQTIFGKPSALSRRLVLEKKYIGDGNEVFGYYSGLSLLNLWGLSNQVPAKPEVVSSKASAIVRKIPYGKQYAVLRKARTPITSNNVSALELLEAFCAMPRYSLDERAINRIKELVVILKIQQKEVFKYASLFPAKAIKNLLYAGVENVFA
ncbi:MAG: hypothetical protein FWD49_03540 [Firmicutes bacterium]|nr:hypothetical protein [Bacillota bacterium]